MRVALLFGLLSGISLLVGGSLRGGGPEAKSSFLNNQKANKVSINNLQLVDKSVTKLSGKAASGTILSSLVTTVWDDQALVGEIQKIAKEAKPGSFAMQLVQKNATGKVLKTETLGKLPLTALKQLQKEAKVPTNGNAANTILSSILTTFWDDQASLQKLKNTLKYADPNSVHIKPIQKLQK